MSPCRLLCLATLAFALALAGPARAAEFEITEFSATPDNLQAGAHSDVQIVTGFTAGPGTPHARDLTIHLPPGLVGNPRAAAVCSTQQFNADTCPQTSRVGSTAVRAIASAPLLPLGLTIDANGDVYNLQPAGGAPARLGIVVRPQLVGSLLDAEPIKVPVAIQVRPRDGGLDSAVASLPTTATVRLLGIGLVPAETWIQRMALMLQGRPANASGPFMTNPTSCIPARASVEATAINGQARQRTAAPFTPTNCDAVPFEPSVRTTVGTTQRGAPTDYTITLGLPTEHAHVKRAEVVLPEGTTISPPVAQGLEACTDAQFGAPEAPASCPATSQIGTVRFVTPLLGELNGTVFQGTPRPTNPFPLLVSIDDQNVRFKLVGVVRADDRTGQITAVLDDLPQTPFTSFSLAFKGGPKAVLANPAECGTHTTRARVTPWSAAPGFPAARDRTPSDAFRVEGCDRPFRPSLSLSAANRQAAAPTGPLGIHIARPDGDREFDSLKIDMPPGLVGRIAAAELCPEDAANRGSCQPGSRVGRVDVKVGAGPEPLMLSGEVFLTGRTGASPFGLAIAIPGKVGPFDLGTIVVRSSIDLRPDGGLTVTTPRFPQFIQGIPVNPRELTLTLDREGFMLNPSSCSPAAARAQFVAVGGAEASASAPYQATGCNAVPFAPTVELSLENRRRGQPSGYTGTLRIPPGHSAVKRIELQMPEGVTISPPAGQGLEACTEEQFGGPERSHECPAASRIGDVRLETPLLPAALDGELFLGPPRPGTLPLFVSVERDGLRIKQIGTTTLNPDNGQITLVFDDMPQVPIGALSLAFRGGPRAILANPPECGSYTMRARATPWSGGADATPSAPFAIDQDCGAQATADRPFRPSLALSAARTQAAAPTGPLAVRIARPDADREIDRMTIEMPPGLIGNLTAAELCPGARAATGDCQPGSRVGRVDVHVGTGPDPLALAGTAFLTGPTGTSPLGLSIVLPGRVGPFDLGTVVVRAAIDLRADGGLTVTTAELPRRLQGIPVNPRELTLTLDRESFILNPSSCAVLTARGRFAAVGGGEATAEAGYQATGCDRLPYAPRISGSIGVRRQTGNGAKPPLEVTILTPRGHAASRSVAVTLPPEVAIDLKKVNALTCRIPQYQAGACPPPTRVGTVSVRTFLLPVPLTGPAILVERGPGQLPALALDLRGPVSLRLEGATAITPRGIRSTFPAVPDVPFERLELALKGGADGALQLGKDLCAGAAPPQIVGEFEGQNGKRMTRREALKVEGCKPAARVSIRLRGLGGARPSLTLSVRRAAGGPKLRRVSLSLPNTLRARPRARGGLTARGDKRRLSRKAARLSRGGTLTLRLPRAGANAVRATLSRGTIAATRSLKRRLGKRPRLAFRVAITDREGTRTRVTVRVRARRR